MTATANPNLDLQRQALGSLQRIHQICLTLELFQVLASLILLSMGFLKGASSLFYLYGTMAYFFTAAFAHAVVYYVLLAVGKNVKEAYSANPLHVELWLVAATRQLHTKLLPFFLLHGLALVALISFSTLSASISAKSPVHLWVTATSAILSIICFIRVFFTLRTNIQYMTSFVTAGRYKDLGV